MSSAKPLDCEELSRKFKAWNPKLQDDENLELSKYLIDAVAKSNPGNMKSSPLDGQQLQKRAHKKYGSAKGVKPYLMFGNLPPEMPTAAIKNLCARHGCVTAVRSNPASTFIFADFATVADMASAYRALEHNDYGFRVRVGKPFYIEYQISNEDNHTNGMPNAPSRYGSGPPKRMFGTSTTLHPRPYVLKTATTQRKDTHCQYNFVANDDAHALERAGLPYPNASFGMKYRMGRVYAAIPDETQQFIEEKTRKSMGKYNEVSRTYRNGVGAGDGAGDGAAKRPAKLGKCVLCERTCDIVCSRCGIYFCGAECQKKAWQHHRLVCGKPNDRATQTKAPQSPTNLENAENGTAIKTPTKAADDEAPPSMADKISNVSLVGTQMNLVAVPESGQLVKISAVSKTNIVFVQSAAPKNYATFFTFISAVQSEANNYKKLSVPPKNGEFVIACFEGQYSRALVLRPAGDASFTIIHVDYGNTVVQPWAEFYKIPDKFLWTRFMAHPFVLRDVPDCYMTNEIRKFMYSYLGGVNMQLKYDRETDFVAKSNNIYSAEFFDEITQQSFNKRLRQLCIPEEPASCDDVLFYDYLVPQQLPTGKDVTLFVMDNSLISTGCISCTTSEYALEIQKFQLDVQRYGEMLEARNYAPRVDELCIAKYSVDQKWYRGRCLELVGDGQPTIIFFDYGNLVRVDVADIRPYPAQFTFPIFTSDCEIAGLPEACGEDLVAKLTELIPNGVAIQCDSVVAYNEENFHVITVQKAINKLDELKLLKKEPITNS